MTALRFGPTSHPFWPVLGPAASDVHTPSYDRHALVPAVVHLGLGGFHRAHQAVYFDRLAERGHTDWGVVGVGIRDPSLGEVLQDQDTLFTVVERSPDGNAARVVGAVVDYLLLARERGAVVDRLADERTRLVTLTITADGYDSPQSIGPDGVFAVVAEALDRRRARGRGAFTVLSCDNLPDSGAAARAATLAAARARDPGLADWIAHTATFPTSMVDRITPRTSQAERDRIEQDFGVTDRWPVITEPFSQWVVEDDFCCGRPPLEEVGVQFVADVAPYKTIKSRLLNGTHCALGYLGLLAGHETSDQAVGDPVIREVVIRMMREEIAPLLPADVPGMDLDRYQDDLMQRFANSAIGDDLTRLARRGSTKMPTYVLPSIHQARAADRPRALLTLVVAAWLLHLRGAGSGGGPADDTRADDLRPLLVVGGHDPRPILGRVEMFGDLAEDREWVKCLSRLMAAIDDQGLAAAARLAIHAHEQARGRPTAG